MEYPITPAIRYLREKKIEFIPHLYDYVEKGGTRESAKQLGFDEHSVVKTLVFKTNEKRPLIVLMHGDLQVSAKNLAELTSWIKAQNKKVFYGSGGVGSIGHILGETFKKETGLNIEHVGYKGSAPMITDLIAGRLSFSFDTLPQNVPHIKAEKLRPIAVTSRARSQVAPDIPTVFEAGHPYLVVGLDPTRLAEAGVVGVAAADERQVVGLERGKDQHGHHGEGDRPDGHGVALTEGHAHFSSHRPSSLAVL